jgi:heptosyltransferase-2
VDPPPLEDAAEGRRLMAEARRLLVRAPNWVGDVVLSLPALRDLRRAFPAARLSVLARPWVADLYRAVSEVDEVIPSQGVGADVKRLRGAFDAAVLLPNSFGVALVAGRPGFPSAGDLRRMAAGSCLTRAPRVPAASRGRSQVYYYRAMLDGLGFDTASPPDASLRCPDEWHTRGRALLGRTGPGWASTPGPSSVPPSGGSRSVTARWATS